MQPPRESSLLREHVDNCRFSSWYPKFEDVSLPSVVVPLPDDFVQYLFDDQIFLPDRFGNGG